MDTHRFEPQKTDFFGTKTGFFNHTCMPEDDWRGFDFLGQETNGLKTRGFIDL